MEQELLTELSPFLATLEGDASIMSPAVHIKVFVH
jgi:hypothetical protein